MIYLDNKWNTSLMEQSILTKLISFERGLHRLSDETNNKIEVLMEIGTLQVENYFFEAQYLTNRRMYTKGCIIIL